MTDSRFQDIEPIVERYFGFISSEFGYIATPPEGASHARHAYLKRYHSGEVTVGIMLYDWDVHEKHWNVFFSKDSRGRLPPEQSIYTIAEKIGKPLTKFPGDAISSKRFSLEDIVLELSNFTRTYAVRVLNGDFSVFDK